VSRIKTTFGERFGLETPILGFSHSVAVTAALCQAGGMGAYGAAHDKPADLPAKLKAIREQVGDRPYCVDIMMPRGMPEHDTLDSVRANLPQEHLDFIQHLTEKHNVPKAIHKSFFNDTLRTPAYFEGQLQALLDSDVDVVAFGIGLTKDAVQRLQARGKKVGALIGSPRHWNSYRDVGLDFVVAQGSEAGAHTGSIATMVLLPQIVEIAGDIPVLAAGGIGHGSQIAGALAMGAQGVWLGTAWLATQEHSMGDHATSDKCREILFNADSGDTVLTRGSSGKPQRQVRSGWTEAWAAPKAPASLKMPYQHALVGELMVAVEEHQIDSLLQVPAGQSVAWSKEMRSVAEVIQDLTAQAEAGLVRAKGALI
jgi:NAD(P)H-dependent flavin oxidoreductase YrpB (nitropropane dioxygenase family)